MSHKKPERVPDRKRSSRHEYLPPRPCHRYPIRDCQADRRLGAGIPTEFDIDAIADEVIGKSEGGYVRIVGVDRFWEIVASHHIGSKGPKIFWDLDELFDGEEEEVAYLMQWSDDMGSFIEIDAEYIELSKELDPYAAAEKGWSTGMGSNSMT